MAQVADIGQLNLNTLLTGAQGVLSSGYDITKRPLAAVVKNVEVTSNYTQPRQYTGVQLEDKVFRDKEKNKLLSIIQPAVSINTQFGKFDFAPYGAPNVGYWKSNVLQAALFAASGVILYSIGMFVWGRHVGRKGG